ncbi:sulfite exporter TauE/SafE family protein [Pseudoalteromonas gelatinilytica]
MELTTIILVGLVVVFTGISKSAFAGALGVFAVPLLILKLPVAEAVGLMLPILIIADLMSVKSYWRMWDTSLIYKLIPGALIGVLIATLMLDSINSNIIGAIISLTCVLFSVKNLYFKKVELNILKGTKGAYLMSLLSGVTSTIVHAGGPPLIMYFTAIGLSPTKFVATTAAFFATINLFKMVSAISVGLFTFDMWLYALAFAPLAIFGNWVGLKIHDKINKAVFLNVMNYLLLILGLWLAYKHSIVMLI